MYSTIRNIIVLIAMVCIVNMHWVDEAPRDYVKIDCVKFDKHENKCLLWKAFK